MRDSVIGICDVGGGGRHPNILMDLGAYVEVSVLGLVRGRLVWR